MSRKRPFARFPGLAVLLAVTLIGGVVLAMTATAADPGEGTVNTTDKSMTGWAGERYDIGSTVLADACALPSNTVCDHFELTVDIPKAHWETNEGGVEVKLAWPDEADDFDLYVYNAAGDEVGSAANGGTSAERVFIKAANAEDGPYRVEVPPYAVTDSGYDGGAWVESRPDTDGSTPAEPVPTEPVSNQPCVDGKAGPFPCKGIDLAGFLPLGSMGDGSELNDIWGWTDPQTGKEYALVGKRSGTSFVDVTDAQNPVYLGDLPSHQSVAGQPVETIFNVWRDIKVYKDHAFVGSEEPSHGMQVFDLTRLRDADPAEAAPDTFNEDAHYSFVVDGLGSQLPPSDRLNTLDNSHNIAINEESGFAYAIGTSTCGGGGPHMINIQDPKNPTFAGCDSADSYTHDNQCVNYRQGDPDPDFAGREICFNSNEDTLTIVDVTDKENPRQLARVPYDGATYTHQAWLTEDRKYLLLDDELDEQDQGGPTKTYIFNVENLQNPRFVNAHQGATTAIDHNQYVKGNRTFQSDYRAGLRVLDITGVASGTLSEVGFFDVYPEDDEPEFNGSWSNYPYFGSGTVIATGIEQGLFVLKPNAEVAGSGGPAEPAPPTKQKKPRKPRK